MFKIGIGPSSSHTLGPWRAAQRFISDLEKQVPLDRVAEMKVLLYGSLAKTGVGHGTDIAVLLGLSGEDPVTIPVDEVLLTADRIKLTQKLVLGGKQEIRFSYEEDLLFLFEQSLPFHPNAVTFQALLSNGRAISETYYSIGGDLSCRKTIPKACCLKSICRFQSNRLKSWWFRVCVRDLRSQNLF